MTGIKETTEAIEDSDTGHDLTVEDISLSNKDLDSRLSELAGSSTSATTTSNTQTVQSGGTTSATPPGTPLQVQSGATVVPQPQSRSVTTGGWAGKAPRAYGERFNWDAQGNVVDRVSNTIVATVGAERKSFERMLPLINAATAEVDKYKGMYDSANKANVVAAGLGLTPEEYSVGARIMAQWKLDPKKTLAFLLKEAQNNGIDTSDFGVTGGGLAKTDVESVVKAVVQEALKPFSVFTEERAQQEQQQRDYDEAVEVTEQYLTEHPDARIHSESIARIMGARPGTSLETAHLILHNHALQNGLDWSKDLIPQVQALVDKTKPNGATPSVQPQQRQLPPINGSHSNPDTIVRQQPSIASGTARLDDIVKDAMREAGMDVSKI